jgi:hypothetical protein
VRYVDFDELRKRCNFTPEEEREIVHRASELIRDQDLASQIARAIAEVDSGRWGMTLPDPGHPFWQVYLAYGEAVLKLLQSERTEELPVTSDEELDAIFAGVAADSCAEDDIHMFCAPGCTGSKTTS